MRLRRGRSNLDAAWATELAGRARQTLTVTVVGTTLLSGVFFVGYFFVLWHPNSTPHVIPLTPLDRVIPFQPQFLIAYLSLWVYLGSGPGLQPSFTAMRTYALWMGALCVTGLAIFYLWPTQAPLRVTLTSFPGIGALHRIDQTGNACPSMHVAAATFTAAQVDSIFRSTGAPTYMRLFNGTWFAAIVYSTLAIRQHVVWDVVGGAVLATAFVIASRRVHGSRVQEG